MRPTTVWGALLYATSKKRGPRPSPTNEGHCLGLCGVSHLLPLLQEDFIGHPGVKFPASRSLGSGQVDIPKRVK